MSIQVLQKPGDIQAAQSPIVFSVITSGSQAYTASEFQYTANLYVWEGAMSNSGSYIYQARKYPNVSGSGIFDFSRMINSTLTRLAADGDASYVKHYKVDFGWQYESGSTYVTQSGALTSVSCSVGGALFWAYDGYSLFPQQINTDLYSGSDGAFPVMSDAWNVTQSVLITDTTELLSAPGVSGERGIATWVGNSNYPLPDRMAITASYTTGATYSGSVGASSFPDSTNSSQQIDTFPSAPADTALPFSPMPKTNLDTYQLNFYSGSVKLGPTFNYKVVCKHYYEPIRIAWKNRYGQFDWLNFYKRHDNQFNTDQRIYQPQLGTWNSSTLSYNQYQTRQQRYIVDATEVLSCNTDWLEEGYNELMKQMLVSDEIYWLYDQTDNNPKVKPLTIQTNSLLFKTHVNNKLIQYTITFDIGQPYKLIL
jgi:hypothetical protein